MPVLFEFIDYSADKVEFKFSASVVQVFHNFFVDFDSVAAVLGAPCEFSYFFLFSA